MPFECPACRGPIGRSPERRLLRCPACGALVRSRAVEGRAGVRTYAVGAVGRPETRRLVEVAWDESQSQRLRSWLLLSSALTLALVLALYLLARYWR